MKSDLTQRFGSARGVYKMRVATVYQQISFVEQGREFVDHIVDGRPCGHEHHDSTWSVKAAYEFRKVIEPADALVIIELPFELGYFLRVSVVSTNAKAMIAHIEQQVATHSAQSDHAKNVFLLHSGLNISLSG